MRQTIVIVPLTLTSSLSHVTLLPLVAPRLQLSELTSKALSLAANEVTAIAHTSPAAICYFPACDPMSNIATVPSC